MKFWREVFCDIDEITVLCFLEPNWKNRDNYIPFGFQMQDWYVPYGYHKQGKNYFEGFPSRRISVNSRIILWSFMGAGNCEVLILWRIYLGWKWFERINNHEISQYSFSKFATQRWSRYSGRACGSHAGITQLYTSTEFVVVKLLGS